MPHVQAAVGAISPAEQRLNIQLANMESAVGASIPYMPQSIVCELCWTLAVHWKWPWGMLCLTGAAIGASRGHVMLWWGTPVGCARGCALIARYYDVDLSVFYCGGGCETIWQMLRVKLDPLFHLATRHAAYPYQALYQAVCDTNPALGRDKFLIETANRWPQGNVLSSFMVAILHRSILCKAKAFSGLRFCDYKLDYNKNTLYC